MKEACVGRDQPFITDDQAAEMAKPGEGAFHDPPPPIAPQLPPILMGGSLMVAACGNERFDSPPGQARSQGVAIIASIGDQAVGPFARASGFPWPPDGDRLEGLLEERDFRRGCRVQVCSQRSTRAIDQNHPLCALATFRRADFGSPFLAGIKLPSAKHSSQRSFSRSCSWAKKARQSLSRRPVSSHSLSRRQQVLGLPYRRGSSLHWAPVHRIQRMPSKQRRSSTRGRPPRGEVLGWGRWTRIASHCAFVSLRQAMPRPPVFRGDSWRDDTSSVRF
jgi:hypothetical protein